MRPRVPPGAAPAAFQPPPITDSVLAWCQANGQPDVLRLLPGFSVSRPPARTSDPEPHRKFQVPLSYQVPEKYLAVVQGVRLAGPAGLVVLPDGSFAAESIFERGHVERSPVYRAPLPAQAARKPGRYYSLVIEYALDGNYYHWIHDAVLRLHLILPHLPPDVQFIVPPKLKRYQLDTLALLGISADRLVPYDGSELWELETLYFSPPNFYSFVDSPAANAWFRDLALEKYGAVQKPRRRIYVSRRHALHHRLVNEPEVQQFLERQGFETVALETLTFPEQVRRFAEADVVIGGQGAGFTNVLFASKGLVLIDIIEDSVITRCFWTLCAVMGQHYWYLLGDTVPIPNWYGDIYITPKKIELALDRALGERGSA